MKCLFSLTFIFIIFSIFFQCVESIAKVNPWKNACSDGQDFDCMENISGFFKCRDEDKCLSYDSCTDTDALYLSGKYCNSFPYYNYNGDFENNV